MLRTGRDAATLTDPDLAAPLAGMLAAPLGRAALVVHAGPDCALAGPGAGAFAAADLTGAGGPRDVAGCPACPGLAGAVRAVTLVAEAACAVRADVAYRAEDVEQERAGSDTDADNGWEAGTTLAMALLRLRVTLDPAWAFTAHPPTQELAQALAVALPEPDDTPLGSTTVGAYRSQVLAWAERWRRAELGAYPDLAPTAGPGVDALLATEGFVYERLGLGLHRQSPLAAHPGPDGTTYALFALDAAQVAALAAPPAPTGSRRRPWSRSGPWGALVGPRGLALAGEPAVWKVVLAALAGGGFPHDADMPALLRAAEAVLADPAATVPALPGPVPSPASTPAG